METVKREREKERFKKKTRSWTTENWLVIIEYNNNHHGINFNAWSQLSFFRFLSLSLSSCGWFLCSWIKDMRLDWHKTEIERHTQYTLPYKRNYWQSVCFSSFLIFFDKRNGYWATVTVMMVVVLLVVVLVDKFR